jgi:cob(I)alamin adenosyltransferase
MEKGYVQIYTGNGKGKTTAALGLTIRAAGAGLKVYIAQFLKQGAYSELKALERFADCVTIEQFGTGKFVRGEPDAADIGSGKKGLAAVRRAFLSGSYDLVVMEEAGVAEKFGVISTTELLEIIREKPDAVELLITGRGVSETVMAAADLITEMREIRHYYNSGVMARIGIES